jgi:uncharacterized repeat protein (TIGR01451 family)
VHPPGQSNSSALGTTSDQQVGGAGDSISANAALWSGTAASWINLNPAGAFESIAYATDGSQQAGYALFPSGSRASLWSGTAESWVDLTPSGASGSVAFAINGGQQAGYAIFGFDRHASIWSGTPESWVDLHPAGASDSFAQATTGTQQAGYAVIGSQHAGLWTGSAGSFVDLHPAGLSASVVNDTTGTIQVGHALQASGFEHAALWSGSAASYVDLHPAGSFSSFAFGASENYQVGQANVDQLGIRASLWSGTAESWVDLHQFLAPPYGESVAHDVYEADGRVYVAGWATAPPGDGSHAILWVFKLGITQRVSVDSFGNEGDFPSAFLSPPAISADGRYAAFDSAATNLIPGGVQAFGIYVHDRVTATTELVSVDSRGNPAEGLTSVPAISDDGRFVAFDSDATNLVNGDRNDITDVFLHDRATGETIRVSVTSAGEEGAASSHAPAISADGRFVVFHANSPLVPEDDNDNTDVYLHDVQTGLTTLISVATDGTAGNGTSFIQDISGDGRIVSFVSSATDLIPNDANDFEPNVYARDVVAGVTELVSVGTDGTRADVGFFDSPSISADGRFVAFSTFASLVPEDTSPFSLDIYLRDRMTSTTELISVSSDEAPGDGRSEAPSVSADGRSVAFQSDSTNFVPESSGIFRDEDIFVRDRMAGTTVRVSESSAGAEGDQRSLGTDISADGLVVIFASEATNLVPNDTNLEKDVFTHDDRPSADLTVTISDSPDPVQKGNPLTYTVEVTNQGSGTALAVELTDQLHSTVHFVSATSTAGSCVEANGVITCELGDLSAASSATVTIVVTPRKVGGPTNSAQVNSVTPDSNPANNSDMETTTVMR